MLDAILNFTLTFVMLFGVAIAALVFLFVSQVFM
jgi:hypothetical protein